MLIFFGILILIASVLLAIFVLVQNPKGGGLSGTFGGISNQTMGVRQTTDFLEKGTWGLIIFIAALCLASSFFISDGTGGTQQKSMMENNITLPAPSTTTPTPFTAPATGETPQANPASGQQQGEQPATPPQEDGK